MIGFEGWGFTMKKNQGIGETLFNLYIRLNAQCFLTFLNHRNLLKNMIFIDIYSVELLESVVLTERESLWG